MQADKHLDGKLREQGQVWHVAGTSRVWVLQVPSVRDLPGLRAVVERAVRACEAAGVSDPFDLSAEVLDGDESLRILAEGSGPELRSYGSTVEPGQLGRVLLTQGATGAFVSSVLGDLNGELGPLFASERQVSKHFDKLLACPDVDERQLFLIVDHRVLSGTMYDALAVGTEVPTADPPVADYITHLWLAGTFSQRVLLWSRSGGWTTHAVGDSADAAKEA